MRDLKNLTRIVLIGVIAFVSVPTFLSLLFWIQGLVSVNPPGALYSFFEQLLSELARILIVIFVMFLFIWKSDWMIERIVKEDAELNLTSWSPAGVYRLAIVIMGGFFIFDSVMGIASEAGRMIDYGIRIKIEGAEWGMYSTSSFISLLLRFAAIGVICGSLRLPSRNWYS